MVRYVAIAMSMQFIRFCLVGGAGLLVNLAVTHLGVTVLHLWYFWAFCIGIIVSWTCSFALNALITFPNHERGSYVKKYLLFIGSYLAVFASNAALVYIATSILGMHYLISIAASAVATTPFSYSFSKYVIYKP